MQKLAEFPAGLLRVFSMVGGNVGLTSKTATIRSILKEN